MAAKKKPAKGKKLGKKSMKKTKGGITFGINTLGSGPTVGRSSAIPLTAQGAQGPSSPGTFTTPKL